MTNKPFPKVMRLKDNKDFLVFFVKEGQGRVLNSINRDFLDEFSATFPEHFEDLPGGIKIKVVIDDGKNNPNISNSTPLEWQPIETAPIWISDQTDSRVLFYGFYMSIDDEKVFTQFVDVLLHKTNSLKLAHNGHITPLKWQPLPELPKEKLNYFHENFPKHGKFIAFYSDGSGADMFKILGENEYQEAGGTIHTSPEVLDQDFHSWLKLPDDFEFWCERD